MKHKLFVVVVILAALSMVVVMSAQASVQDKLASSRDVNVHLVYTDSASGAAERFFQVAWRSGIRTLRFYRV